jgi:competence protein ComEC
VAVCILAAAAGCVRGCHVGCSTARAGEAVSRSSGAFVGTVVSDPLLASRGAKVRVRLRAPRADVALLVEGDAPALGERVAFCGTALESGRGSDATGRLDGLAATVIAAPGTVERTRPDGWLAGLYAWRAVALDRLAGLMGFADQRAIVAGVTLGYRGWVGEAVQGDFRRSGLSHLLAVSGTHVVVVCGLVWGLASACGASAGWRRFLAGAALLGFTALTGFQPSALRAALCWVLATAGWSLGRRTSRLAALGVAAAALALADPWIVFTIGFRLSFGAVLALIWWAPAFEARLARLPGWLSRPLAATLAVQAGLLPLLAESFSQLSIVAPLANLAAAPAFPPLLGAGLLGLGSAGLGDAAAPIARVCLAVAGAAAGWVASVARITARPWWAALPTAGLPLAGTPLYFGAIELLVRPRDWGRTGHAVPGPLAARVRAWRIGALAAAVLAAVLFATFRPAAAGPPRLAQMRVLDVGQGDAILLRTPSGHDVLVDGGPSGSAVKRSLARDGVGHVDLAVVTHPHTDHYRGMLAVLSDLSVDELWESPAAVADPGYSRMLATARARGVPIRAPPPGTIRTIDRWLRLDVLGPPAAGAGNARTQPSANDASLVIMARCGTRRFLLSGDVSARSQAELTQRVGPTVLACDVYKVAHHGSAGSLDGAFLDALGTPVAVIPVGRPNRYGHPSRPALEAFAVRGWSVHRTDDHGEVAFSTDGTRLWVRREKDRGPR